LGDLINNSEGLDEKSFEMLFRSNFHNLCFFAQMYLKDVDISKEIVQEAFVSLWDKRTSIEKDKNVISYLKTSIYNKSLNYLRDNKKFNKDMLNYEQIFDENNTVETDTIVTNEIKMHINDAIESLPEKCREIFVLSRNENLKYQEIADLLKISVKTVEAQMSKALQIMRIKLAEFIEFLILIIFLIK